MHTNTSVPSVNPPTVRIGPLDRTGVRALLATLTTGLRNQLHPAIVAHLVGDGSRVTLYIVNAARSAAILMRCHDAGGVAVAGVPETSGIWLYGAAVTQWADMAPWPSRHTPAPLPFELEAHVG